MFLITRFSVSIGSHPSTCKRSVISPTWKKQKHVINLLVLLHTPLALLCFTVKLPQMVNNIYSLYFSSSIFSWAHARQSFIHCSLIQHHYSCRKSLFSEQQLVMLGKCKLKPPLCFKASDGYPLIKIIQMPKFSALISYPSPHSLIFLQPNLLILESANMFLSQGLGTSCSLYLICTCHRYHHGLLLLKTFLDHVCHMPPMSQEQDWKVRNKEVLKRDTGMDSW